MPRSPRPMLLLHPHKHVAICVVESWAASAPLGSQPSRIHRPRVHAQHVPSCMEAPPNSRPRIASRLPQHSPHGPRTAAFQLWRACPSLATAVLHMPTASPILTVHAHLHAPCAITRAARNRSAQRVPSLAPLPTSRPSGGAHVVHPACEAFLAHNCHADRHAPSRQQPLATRTPRAPAAAWPAAPLSLSLPSPLTAASRRPSGPGRRRSPRRRPRPGR